MFQLSLYIYHINMKRTKPDRNCSDCTESKHILLFVGKNDKIITDGLRGVKYPDASIRGTRLAAMQACPLGSLLAEINFRQSCMEEAK